MHLTVIILSFVLLFFYSSSGLFTATVTAVFTKTGRAGFNIFQALWQTQDTTTKWWWAKEEKKKENPKPCS